MPNKIIPNLINKGYDSIWFDSCHMCVSAIIYSPKYLLTQMQKNYNQNFNGFSIRITGS